MLPHISIPTPLKKDPPYSPSKHFIPSCKSSMLQSPPPPGVFLSRRNLLYAWVFQPGATVCKGKKLFSKMERGWTNGSLDVKPSWRKFCNWTSLSLSWVPQTMTFKKDKNTLHHWGGKLKSPPPWRSTIKKTHFHSVCGFARSEDAPHAGADTSQLPLYRAQGFSLLSDNSR